MELNKEQYEYQKTLSEIGMKIAEGRAVLSQLDEGKEAFILKREEEALERINHLVQESEEALSLVDANRNDLTAIYHGVSDLLIFLTKTVDTLEANVSELNSAQITFTEWYNSKEDEHSKAMRELKAMRALVETDRSQLQVERQRLLDLQRKVESQQQSLASAFEQLRKRNK